MVITKIVLAAAFVLAGLANAGPVAVKRSGCLNCNSDCMQINMRDTACVHDCEQANNENPSCATIMPPKRSELLEVVAPPPTVEERDTTACQLCDTVCITDDDSLDQACVDSCACAALPKRQATMSEPVIPDPSCLDCDTACTNATSSSSYYDCLVSCESKNSADCGHTPKRQVGSAV